jgi:hypothetical protein
MRRLAGPAGGVVRLGSAIGEVCWACADTTTPKSDSAAKHVIVTDTFSFILAISTWLVIASQRVRAEVAGPMTGSAKQSSEKIALDCFVTSLLAMTV